MRTTLLVLVTTSALACTGPERRPEPAETTPKATPAPPRAMAAGAASTCALIDGAPHCWGSNYQGELALGYLTPSKFPPQQIPVAVPALEGATSLALGYQHGCAVHEAGHVMCWGNQIQGELGLGSMAPGAATKPRGVIGLPTASMVDTGGSHTCALDREGSVWCWGNNNHGQLGNGGSKPSATPIKLEGLEAAQIALGNVRSCARTLTGTLTCWGDGPIGDGTDELADKPRQVPGLSGVLEVALGGDHTCARTKDGVFCWGDNRNGEVGDGTKTPVYAPKKVEAIGAVRSIATGGDNTCALLEDGGVMCWGLHMGGATPTRVDGVTGATALALGGEHACARLTDGAIACWGNNHVGQLGDGTTDTRASAAPIKR